MEILIFNNSDITKSGKLKKKNNTRTISEEDFIKYVKDNDLTPSYGYIDLLGTLSNGERFRAYHRNIPIGVSRLVKKINGE